MRNGAELLVETLSHQGIDTIFGFPGDTGVAFYDVLAQRAETVRHVLARDERHAGYMADAYARTRRQLAVCEAASGAGAVYLASGLGESFASSIPILAITTDNNRRSNGTAAISEINQKQLFAAVTKWQRSVDNAADIPYLVYEAIKAATTGRPGPVVLILPEDVLEETVDISEPKTETPASSLVVDSRQAAPTDAVKNAAAQLVESERPVAVVGGGVHLSGAWFELARLAEHAAMPVATTIHGKGALDEAHPLSLGVIGSNGARDYANARLADSDFVLFVGTRANATDTLGFTVPPRGGPQIVHVDINGTRAGRNYPGSLPLVGDAATVLDQVRSRTTGASEEARTHCINELATARERWTQEDAEDHTPSPEPGKLRPRDVIRALSTVFGRDTWVVADAGTPTPYLSCYWEAPGDGWRVVIPRGHGPMGYAIPASIGIAVAHPGQRVLCLTTENSVAMALGEWETAGRLGLPITYVVLDNTSMAWIKMIQHLYLEGRYFGVDPGPVDSVQLAQGMGLTGVRAHDSNHLAALIKEAIDYEGPLVIHVAVPEHMDSPPPVGPWQAALSGNSTTRPIH